jgi:tetratricopeptide (TPR) repeat protein
MRPTWGDYLAEVKAAIAAEDWHRGERALELLEANAESWGEPGQLASAAFYRGMFEDARGQLAAAEQAFREAVSWDERAHGRESEAVADALRSLGMVQGRRRDAAAAIRTFGECAAVYAAIGRPAHAAEAHNVCARALMTAHPDLAIEACRRAERTALAAMPAARAQLVWALVTQGEILRRGGEGAVALTIAESATRHGTPPLDREVAAALASAWTLVGFLSRHVLRREAQAVLAYAIARDVAPEGPVRRNAEAQIASSPERALATSPIASWRVAHVDRELRSIALVHPHEGARVARADLEVAPGAEVEVSKAADGSLAVR